MMAVRAVLSQPLDHTALFHDVAKKERSQQGMEAGAKKQHKQHAEHRKKQQFLLRDLPGFGHSESAVPPVW